MTTSVIQALAMGIPVIATRHSGFPEQVIDGENGYLVPEGEYRALAETILYYFNHTEVWPNFSRAGRALASSKYDSNVLIDTQVAFYEELMHR